MGTYEEFTQIIKQTEVMKRLLADLEEEPAKLLVSICKKYQASHEPVADHHLNPSGYVGQVALRALVSAGLVERQAGDRFSIYRYNPTPAGMEYYLKLISEERHRR